MAKTTDDEAGIATIPGGPRWIGLAGVAVGLTAMCMSIVAYHVLEEPARVAKSSFTVDVGFAKFTRESAPPPPQPDVAQWVTPHQLRIAAIVLATVAIVLGVTSWVRREGFWPGFGACAFAAAGIAWVWFIVAFAILLLSGGLFTFFPVGQSSKAA